MGYWEKPNLYRLKSRMKVVRGWGKVKWEVKDIEFNFWEMKRVPKIGCVSVKVLNTTELYI